MRFTYTVRLYLIYFGENKNNTMNKESLVIEVKKSATPVSVPAVWIDTVTGYFTTRGVKETREITVHTFTGTVELAKAQYLASRELEVKKRKSA